MGAKPDKKDEKKKEEKHADGPKEKKEKKPKKEEKAAKPEKPAKESREALAAQAMRNPLRAHREHLYRKAEKEMPGFNGKRRMLKGLLTGWICIRVCYVLATLFLHGFSFFQLVVLSLISLVCLFFSIGIYNGIWPLSILVLAQAFIGLARLANTGNFPGMGLAGFFMSGWYGPYLLLSLLCCVIQLAAAAYALTGGLRCSLKIGRVKREIAGLIGEGPEKPK